MVVITRKASGVDSYYLAHDEAGALAGRHLAEQGYEEYLFLGNTRDMKYRGFVDALAKIRPDFGAHLTVITTKKTEEIRQALEEHFKKTDHCTGIFTYNDRRAIQALGILEEMGIRIPEQAGVIGFDNTCIYVNICIRVAFQYCPADRRDGCAYGTEAYSPAGSSG